MRIVYSPAIEQGTLKYCGPLDIVPCLICFVSDISVIIFLNCIMILPVKLKREIVEEFLPHSEV